MARSSPTPAPPPETTPNIPAQALDTQAQLPAREPVVRSKVLNFDIKASRPIPYDDLIAKVSAITSGLQRPSSVASTEDPSAKLSGMTDAQKLDLAKQVKAQTGHTVPDTLLNSLTTPDQVVLYFKSQRTSILRGQVGAGKADSSALRRELLGVDMPSNVSIRA